MYRWTSFVAIDFHEATRQQFACSEAPSSANPCLAPVEKIWYLQTSAEEATNERSSINLPGILLVLRA